MIYALLWHSQVADFVNDEKFEFAYVQSFTMRSLKQATSDEAGSPLFPIITHTCESIAMACAAYANNCTEEFLKTSVLTPRRDGLVYKAQLPMNALFWYPGNKGDMNAKATEILLNELSYQFICRHPHLAVKLPSKWEYLECGFPEDLVIFGDEYGIFVADSTGEVFYKRAYKESKFFPALRVIFKSLPEPSSDGNRYIIDPNGIQLLFTIKTSN